MKSYFRFLVALIAWEILSLTLPNVLLGIDEKRPIVSELTAPEGSMEVRELPVKELRQAGDPVREFPRQVGNFQVPGILKYQSEAETSISRQSDWISLSGTPDPTLSFEGMSLQNGGAGFPPDTIGDVGPNHYVQMVNSSFAIFDKNGTLLTGPTNINQLWQGQGNPCETCNDGDPVVVYDPLADRWLLSQFAVCQGPPFYECIAISQTADPTGAYYLYAFEIPDNNFPDYPKFGVWPDAYYMAANENDVGAYAFDRTEMLLGRPATLQKFEATGNFMLPCDLDGSTPPPTGTPNYFYTMKSGNILEIWEFYVDFDVPSNSSFTLAQTLNTLPFNYGVCGFSWNCIPQKDTAQRLDVISEWPMWRLQYRNFGTHETMVGNFTVDVDDFANHAGIRWFELRWSAGSWYIHQEGTHAPDEHHRWMGSIAMDGAGNIALGYSVSSDTLFPSIRYAIRRASDEAGILRTEVSLIEGTASQIGYNRWGDYSSMTVDPSDDATFWYTNEYYTDSALGWQTRIGTFKIMSTAEVVRLTVAHSDGNNSGCFIATAAFGSGMGRELKILENFRDHILMPRAMGRHFVKFYYRFSPPIAHVIERSDMLRAVVRWGLIPIVGVCWLALTLGLAPTLALVFLFLLLSAIPVYGHDRKGR